mgnify:CR=1 FL=1
MTKTEVLDRLYAFMINSNVDSESKLFKDALEALLAINLNKVEEE